MTEIQHAFRWIGRRRLGMKQRPATVEYRPPKVVGEIDRPDVGRAERGHKKHELQVRHAGMVDIERLHQDAIIGRDTRRVNEVYDAPNKARHVCERRQDGEAAVSVENELGGPFQ